MPTGTHKQAEEYVNKHFFRYYVLMNDLGLINLRAAYGRLPAPWPPAFQGLFGLVL